MHHLAFMKKEWGFIDKILSGRKTIESRWYKAKKVPWGKIKRGDTVYFKNSGESVTAKADVSSTFQFEELTPKKVKGILDRQGRELGISKENFSGFYKRFKDKRYCILIFLENPQRIKPFKIDKKGFGAMASWICVDDIGQIKI